VLIGFVEVGGIVHLVEADLRLGVRVGARRVGRRLPGDVGVEVHVVAGRQRAQAADVASHEGHVALLTGDAGDLIGVVDLLPGSAVERLVADCQWMSPTVPSPTTL
jgi:hypothetical protein